MISQDDGKHPSTDKTPHDEEAAKHLADFSGFDGHGNHDRPGSDEVLMIGKLIA